MTKGDIVYVNFPFTDLSGVKVRPALVIEVFGLDVVVIFITSKLHQFDTTTDLIVEPDFGNRLKVPSVFKAVKILTLSKDLVKAKVGVLDSDNLKLVQQKIISGLRLA